MAEENLSGQQAAAAKESSVPKKHESAQAQKGAATEHWKQEPDDHDFPAVADDLSLLLPEQMGASLAVRLKDVEKVERKAKDRGGIRPAALAGPTRPWAGGERTPPARR